MGRRETLNALAGALLGALCLTSSAQAEQSAYSTYLADISVTTPAEPVHFERTVTFQEQPSLVPELTAPAQPQLPGVAPEFAARVFGSGQVRRSLLSAERQARATTPGSSFVLGAEAQTRATTDAGSLLGKSPSTSPGLAVQRRNPVVSDPRIRGSRVGRLAASGSHWVPARIDLDTMMSKIDSRIISDIISINGPYSARYGPDFAFYDVQLLSAPRYDDGYQSAGSSSFDFQQNGEQWYGRQALWGGANDWGYRVGYGHRTGNDYRSGNGVHIPASYNSRDVDVALGHDLNADSSVDFHYLRLDQTGVELPGQAFDIDMLYTDGYELLYERRDQAYYDRFALDVWYNRTRFDGSAQREGKRRQFPFYDFLNFNGVTDVDSMSLGFRAEASWESVEGHALAAGVDLRYLKQELNEITSGRFIFNIWQDANSPIPRSDYANPGMYFEYRAPVGERLALRSGARLDFAATDIVDDPAKLSSLGAFGLPITDILGTDEFEQSFTLWNAFVTTEYEINPCWTAVAGFGYAERPPTLTELYAAQTFMFVLQNGLNTVTGDPTLDRERLWQIDAGLNFDTGGLRGRAGLFHAWINDYITYENLRVFQAPPAGQVEQVNLIYVNTDLATLAGAELYVEFDLDEYLTPFATFRYVEGRDHTRNGDFATLQASPLNPTTKVPDLPRGSFSGVAGGSEEPLPSISPMESILGLRLHQPGTDPIWSIEASTRLVEGQNRVAESLLESATPGFSVWDLRGYWQAYDDLLVVAGVENFTDREYREHLDFRSANGRKVFQPGVTFYFGSELTY